MKLTDDQQKKAIDFLKAKWKPQFACPCCGNTDWNISPEIFQVTQFSQGTMVVGGPVVPLVVVTCTNCGNTVLINALMSKIYEESAEKKGGKVT